MSDQNQREDILQRCAALKADNLALQQDLGAQLVNGVGPIHDLVGNYRRLDQLQQQVQGRALDPVQAIATLQASEEFTTIQAAIIRERRAGAETLALHVGISPQQALPLFVIDTYLRRFQASLADMSPDQQAYAQPVLARCTAVLAAVQQGGTQTLGDLYAAWDAVLDARNAVFSHEDSFVDGVTAEGQQRSYQELQVVVDLVGALAMQLEAQQAPEALVAGCWSLHHEGHGILTAFASTDLLTLRGYLTRLAAMYKQGVF